MEKEELEFRAEELRKIAEKIGSMFLEVINGLKPVKELKPLIKEWEEKRQILNNKDIGVLLYISQLSTKNFNLYGDPATDLGQINKSRKPDKA